MRQQLTGRVRRTWIQGKPKESSRKWDAENSDKEERQKERRRRCEGEADGHARGQAGTGAGAGAGGPGSGARGASGRAEGRWGRLSWGPERPELGGIFPRNDWSGTEGHKHFDVVNGSLTWKRPANSLRERMAPLGLVIVRTNLLEPNRLDLARARRKMRLVDAATRHRHRGPGHRPPAAQAPWPSSSDSKRLHPSCLFLSPSKGSGLRLSRPGLHSPDHLRPPFPGHVSPHCPSRSSASPWATPDGPPHRRTRNTGSACVHCIACLQI
ncbi:uncharacterized protein LOC121479383 [Vulpes lagopus]|uniref:uncharacterized protein LOC121479383 n=1 Tax=Vulpes lagopus TaxID=494514 RepID=UPI001BC9F776|nr:uncharacterized protein LOC121479383 [Vulpes lagopus]